MNREVRKLAGASVRAADAAAGPNKLVGYAARFGAESAILCDRNVNDGRPFVEVIDPAAFTRTLEEMPDVRALYNHDTGAVLGRTRSGTLALAVDESGLAFTCELPDTEDGRRARVLVGRGDIDGCSFGFVVLEDRIEDRGPDLPALRTLLDVELHEVSIAVAFPAYEATEVSLRARRTHRPATAPATPRLARARRLIDLDSA